ncbi:hypothetical protein [Pseudomonas abieticivorans]|uniref:hypothetical protein n=1 Tax=Pseudomonas abieticivorans TaxID=2931382 RepID=UPI0020BF9AB6|nr:hypothetical protein [Pseudomonas sp. PIA16]
MKAIFLLATSISLAIVMECSAHTEHNERSVSTVFVATEKSEKMQPNEHTKLCLSDLKTAASDTKARNVSAFREFNHYPPTPGVDLDPHSVDLSKVKKISITEKCLEQTPLSFIIETGGISHNGNARDLNPIKAWRTDNGFAVIYLYKGYKEADGTGHTINLSAAFYNDEGMPLDYIDNISTWYNNEGTVHIRDAELTDRKITVSKVVFDPERLTRNGKVLEYSQLHDKQIVLEFANHEGHYIEQPNTRIDYP